jgi:hypothetical protein
VDEPNKQQGRPLLSLSRVGTPSQHLLHPSLTHALHTHPPTHIHVKEKNAKDSPLPPVHTQAFIDLDTLDTHLLVTKPS